MNGIGATIKRLREERGWTLKELADKVGLDHSNLSRRENGLTQVKPHERFAFAKAFEMSVVQFDEQWRDFDISRTKGDNGIPVINRAPAGGIVDYEEYGVDSGQGMEYVDFGEVRDRLAFGVIVVGDSMEPRLKNGDYLILSPVDPYRGDGKLSNGRIVFVRFAPEYRVGCTLARFYSEGGGRIRLQKDNAAYRPIVCQREDIQLVAVAVERREKL